MLNQSLKRLTQDLDGSDAHQTLDPLYHIINALMSLRGRKTLGGEYCSDIIIQLINLNI